MKKTIIIAITLILAGFLFTSCQKSKETEGKKEVQVRDVHKEEGKSQPAETKSEVQAEQQPPAGQQLINEHQEKPAKSPLTEKEQKEFQGGLEIGLSYKDAMKSLSILLTGDHKTIRWYQDWGKEYNFDDKARSDKYEWDICAVVKKLATTKALPALKASAFSKPLPPLNAEQEIDLTLRVAEEKLSYPKGVSCAAEVLGWYQDKKAVPVLKKLIINKDPQVRLQAAGSLLILGEGDTALPVLDEIAKAGFIPLSPFVIEKLFAWEIRKESGKEPIISHTKLLDIRGQELLIKALDYPSDEVKAAAATRLAEMGIEKEKTESAALGIVQKLMHKTEKDYGIGQQRVPNETYTKSYVLPGYEGKKLEELKEHFSSDLRACNNAIFALGWLKSKKAVPLLKYIMGKNTEGGNVCWEDIVNSPATNALEKINKGGNGK
jgi:hypothetical protein